MASHFHFLFSTLLLLLTTTIAQMNNLHILLSFKNSLANPSILPTWSSTANSPCSFYGISCSSSGFIESIDLRNLPFSTTFPIALLSIPSLVSLSLRSVNLSGPLPKTPICSSNLSFLDISSNSLTSSLPDLFVFVSSCHSLVYFNFSYNHVTPGDDFNILSYVPALEFLDLSYSKISSEDSLRWILSGAVISHGLDLSGNNFSRSEIPAIANCSELQHLDLSGAGLAGEIGSGVFRGCEKLEYLNISGNHFVGNLPAELASCTAMKAISVSKNNFSGEFPAGILASMPQLRVAEFAFNNFSGMLGDSIAELRMLEVLDLSSNYLSGAIPSVICPVPNHPLKELYLQNNRLSGDIPESLSNCTNLVSLDLSLNFITGAIPASLGLLSELQNLIMWQNFLDGEIPAEISRMKKLENLILDSNGLSGSIPDQLSSCSNLKWLSLSSNRLSGRIPSWIGQLNNLAILKLANNSFSGPIPPEIGDCKSLVWLDLNSNKLNGSIPGELAKQSGKIVGGLVKGKRYVYLRNDRSSACRGSGSLLEFAGIRPEDLNRLSSSKFCNFTWVYEGITQYTFDNNGSMIFLDLSNNQLDGQIPKELGNMYHLMIMNLGFNMLSGLIPSDLGSLRFLAVLDLSHNALEGPIPAVLSGLMLSDIDFSYNKLNGSIPDRGCLATFPAYRYENNPGLCGFPLPPCGGNINAKDGDHRQKSQRRQASLVGSIAMGLLFSLFCIVALIIILVEYKKRQLNKDENSSVRDIYLDSWSRSLTGNSNWKLTGTQTVINLATIEKPLKDLTLGDLIKATNGFHSDAKIGSGGFGDVFKARLEDGTVVAVKKSINVSGQGHREFMAEMETIGRIKHRNLVPLLGYCRVGEERFLVYQYMKYGSLDDVLHNRKKGGIKLNWSARRKIALGAARGLSFLHHNCIPHIIHRDMKSSNVLLDENMEARVSDFGMARLVNVVDTHLSVSTLAGTPGYVPPEYYQSFQCTTKGDVYSFGVVLLELLTGKPPTGSLDFGDNNNLVGWVKQHSKLRIVDVFDPELLKEDPTLELELLEHLKVACACLDDRPSRRPTMLKVMSMFKEIQAGSIADSKASGPAALVDESFHDDMSLKESNDEKA